MNVVGPSLRGAAALLGRERRWKWAVLVVVALVGTGLEILGAVLVYGLIAIVALDSQSLSLPLLGDVSAWFGDVPVRTIQLRLAAAVGTFFVVRGAFAVARVYAQSRVAENAGRHVAVRLVRGYLAMPYLFHTKRNSSELVRNAFDSAQRFVSHVVLPLLTLATEAILVLGIALVLLVVSPLATFLAAVFLAPTFWFLVRAVQPKLKALGAESQAARVGSIRSLQQAFSGFRDIRLFAREDHFAAEFDEHRTRAAAAEYRKATVSAAPRAIIETALVLIIVSIFMIALLSGRQLETIAATLGMFAYVGLRLQGSLQAIAGAINNLRFGQAVLDDLCTDMALIRNARLTELPEDPARTQFHDRIEVRELTFAYAPDAPLALRHIDLAIHQGEFVGICGPTGGGKSTLLDIIIGLLPPTTGQVLIDGEPLEGRERWWQAQLGVVSQSVFLLDDTLRANVAFGRPDEEIDPAALRHAVSRAQLDDVVRDLPAGLDTEVGERGIRLSGGQRQRLAVARAIYREPTVMVFDEGTSALDSATEAALMAAVDELKQGRTFIAVAHRISTVRHADRIVVVDAGRIVAEGPYDELIRSSAKFRSLAG